ncbi:uncharacterized protein V6R79_016259 [Siganus canaliculatus]
MVTEVIDLSNRGRRSKSSLPEKVKCPPPPCCDCSERPSGAGGQHEAGSTSQQSAAQLAFCRLASPRLASSTRTRTPLLPLLLLPPSESSDATYLDIFQH